MKSPVRIGIIGVGAMGGHHARTIASGLIENLTLTALCDGDASRLEPFSTIAHFKDSDALIESGLVDAVLIATPHYSHTTIGIRALNAGLHVLVEKPISVHKADAEKLAAAHLRPGQKFGAMFNQRTDPCFQKVRSLVQGKDLGEIRRIQWTITDWFRSQAYYDSGGWRATWAGEGGGVLLNQAVHNIDLFQWIFGMPQSVRALCRIARYHEIEVEDEVTAIFEYPNETTAVFITSTGEAPGVNRLEVAGERGLLCLENGSLRFIRNEIETSKYSRSTEEGYEKPHSWKIEIPIGSRGEQHNGILRNFGEAILHDAPLIAPAEEGIASVELINAMLLASFRDKRVQLPIDTTEYETLLAELISTSKEKAIVKSYAGSKPNYL